MKVSMFHIHVSVDIATVQSLNIIIIYECVGDTAITLPLLIMYRYTNELYIIYKHC